MPLFASRLCPSWPDSRSPGRLAWPAAAIVALTLAAGSAWATPRDQVLHLVPGDVGFCVVVSDLRGQAEKLLATPWFKALREAPLVKAIAKAPETKKLRDLEAQFQKHLKVGFARLCNDVLGDLVVLAYRPGPPDKKDQEQGLVLVYARDADLLAKVVQLLNRDLKKHESRVYKKVKYFRRVESEGKVSFYFLDGKELAFSSAEEMLRQVIDRRLDRKSGSKGPVDFSLLERLQDLGVDKALVAVWVNPAAFTPHIRKKAEAAKGAETVQLQNFLTYWQALEGVGYSLAVPKNIELKVAVRANPKRLPPNARRFFTEASKPSELWNRFPPDALAAMAGRIDAVAFADFLGSFLPAEGKKAFMAGLNRGVGAGLGLDLAKDVLPQLGPDWGFCVTAPADKDVLVPLLTWALQVRPGPTQPPVDKALFNGLSTFALYAVLSYNGASRPDTLQLKTTKQDKVEVKYLKNDKGFPAGFQPAFAVKEGYLLVASCPEAIRTFTKRSSATATSEEVPVLRVSLHGWAKFLKARRETLTKYLADKDQISQDRAAKHLQNLLWGLDLFDSLELNQRTGNGLATWTLSLKPAEPAKK
jgi:Protein of unknown function (DUF3352)